MTGGGGSDGGGEQLLAVGKREKEILVDEVAALVIVGAEIVRGCDGVLAEQLEAEDATRVGVKRCGDRGSRHRRSQNICGGGGGG